MKTERTTKLLRFVTGKIGHDHRDLEHLLLEQRHAERSFEHRLQSVVEIRHSFLAGTSIEIRMHHVALNRPRSNDRDLDHYVVKTFRFHPRQRRHLRAALDLKNADRVRVLHDLEGLLVIFRNVGEIERPATFAAKLERVLHHRHHPETEKIDFYDAKIFAIVLVPLRNDPARHRCVLQRNERAKLVLTNDHSAGMCAKIPRQTETREIKPNKRLHPRMIFRWTRLLEKRLEIERVRKIAVCE